MGASASPARCARHYQALARGSCVSGYPALRYFSARLWRSRRHHGRPAGRAGRRVRSHSALVNNMPAWRCLATHSVWA
jgi:hypothetical protein